MPPQAASTDTYNTSDELTASTTPDGTAAAGYTHDESTYTYNGYGEVLTSVSPDGNVSGGNVAAYTTTNTYDPAGRLTEVQAPYTGSIFSKTIVSLDAVGNVLTTTDPDTLVTTSAYDADNRVCWTAPPGTTITVPPQSCSSPPTGSTSYKYRAGTTDQTQVTDPDGNATTYSPCIRCDAFDGFPCAVNAKADAQVI